MKWKAPKMGDTRIVKRFAFIPITTQVYPSNDNETRWLCFVTLRQSYNVIHKCWFNNWFVDKD